MEYPLLNRTALIVKLKKPFIDWVILCNKENEREGYQLRPEDITIEGFDSKHIYLIPEYDTNEQCEKYVRKNCGKIFESELDGWYTDPELWPKKRIWKEFKEWFDYEIHTVIFDTDLKEPLESE